MTTPAIGILMGDSARRVSAMPHLMTASIFAMCTTSGDCCANDVATSMMLPWCVRAALSFLDQPHGVVIVPHLSCQIVSRKEDGEKMKASLVDGVLVENVGSSVVVMIPRRGTVVSVSGAQAALLESLVGSAHVEVEHSDALDELVSLGIAEIQGQHRGLSRRSLLAAGSGAVGAGALALALPTAAMASSIVRSLKGIVYNIDGKVVFWVSDEYVAPGDSPADWWPDPKPSSDLSDVSTLTVDGASISLDVGSSSLASNESNSLQWPSTIDYADALSSYTGTFRWAGHHFSVTFQQLNG